MEYELEHGVWRRMVWDTPTDRVCPECRVSKHQNCDTTAWDVVTDQPCACSCWAEGHGALVH